MNPQSKYIFHSDPGHGWIEIPRAELVFLGISSEISAFSYVRGDRVFLEEDADAHTWLSAWSLEGFDVRNRVQSLIVDSTPIRGYARYLPTRLAADSSELTTSSL